MEIIPYIYQSEFYNAAWGQIVRTGFYIDPSGTKYMYDQPTLWKSYERQKHTVSRDRFVSIWGSETDAIIEATDLYSNIQNSRKRSVLFKFMRKPILLSQIVLADMLSSETIDYGQQMCDAGIESKCLYIYDHHIDKYKRVLLRCGRDRVVVNQSEHAQNIIRAFER
jgi:hypothetical protein